MKFAVLVPREYLIISPIGFWSPKKSAAAVSVNTIEFGLFSWSFNSPYFKGKLRKLKKFESDQ
jgi:hypothetical protein